MSEPSKDGGASWRFVPAHVAEGDAEVRHPDGWLICCTPSDELAKCIVTAVNTRPAVADLVKALELAAARFNLMGGVGLVNGADPKVGYREAMAALSRFHELDRASNGSAT